MYSLAILVVYEHHEYESLHGDHDDMLNHLKAHLTPYHIYIIYPYEGFR